MRSLSKINEIILHCSASDRDHDAKDIDIWHKERGWMGIGYNYVIRRNGTVEVGRPLHLIPAHCEGHNKNSIGVCVVGKTYFLTQQLDALATLIHDLTVMFNIKKVSHHNDYNKNKECPVFKRQSWGGRLNVLEKSCASGLECWNKKST